ncbi:energy transducer TonB [Vicingaceae bacterium]|nr:energy transducer TonB [Vicingaceae bacterium]MDB4062092.1 energy transducer TonB [Vicingaceae bacterium]
MKNPNHKREQRFPFAQRFLTGLIIALALSLTAFEWTTIKTTSVPPIPEIDTIYVYDGEILPPIKLQKEKIQELKPKSPIPEIEIVKTLTPEIVDKPVDEPTITEKPTVPEVYTTKDYGPDENYTETGTDRIHTVVEIFAHYDECKELRGLELQTCSQLSIKNKVARLFRVTEQMKSIGGNQSVLMSFVIDKEGNITNIETVQTQNKYVAKAAKKTIEKLPQLNPAMQQGIAVSLFVEIPITVRM